MLKAAGSGVGKGDGLPSPPAKQLFRADGSSYRERLRKGLTEDYRIRGVSIVRTLDSNHPWTTSVVYRWVSIARTSN